MMTSRRTGGVALLMVVALIAGLFAVVPAGAQAPADPAALFIDAATPAGDRPASASTARSRYVTVNRGALAALTTRARAGARPEVALNLFPDAAYTGVITKVESSGGGQALSGSLKGRDGYFYLVTYGDAFIAHVASNDGVFEVSLGAGGKHRVVEIDHSKLVDHAPGALVDRPAPPADQPVTAMSDAANSIDIMVLYTDDARIAEGSTAAMKARIALAVTETNQAYLNAGVTPRLRLVHVEEVVYTETGNMSTDLNRLRIRGDGQLEIAHTLRNTYGADMVGLIVDNGGSYCGLAADILASPNYAFQVTDRECATGYYSFGHEFGHLQGARHDMFVDPTLTPFAYGHGWVNAADSWRTVMAYGDACGGCTRLQWFSNPGKTYGGDPMGDPNARNFQVLNETAATVANFRLRVSGANFNSNMNTTHDGWVPIFGTWSHFSSMHYRTPGVKDSFSSISRTFRYGDFTFQARVKRTGCVWCENGLIIRGDSGTTGDTKEWLPSYGFFYGNDQTYTVVEYALDGSTTVLKGWTFSTAIAPNAWNTLKVTAVGRVLRFYINGTQVWSGNDPTLRVGNVGIAMYRDSVSAGNMFSVDWAKLTTNATGDVAP